MRLSKGGDHKASGGTGADEFVFSFLTPKAQSDVTITDFELGVDEFSVMGQDAASYLEALSVSSDTDVVSEEKGHAVLTLHSGDTITFKGISEAEFEDFFGL
jgi:Ca2+-binding RTX toxin-like protein